MAPIGIEKHLVAALVIVIAAFAAGNDASAHVRLDAPNGGEVLEVGSTTTVVWTVVVQHDTLDWDLWYSTTGSGGPWLPVAEDLPVGDPTTGSEHTFTWTVPDTPSDQVRVRVRQDNGGNDYYDESDSDLSIVGGLFADGFESGDASGWSTATP